ncbi:MAG: sulfatase [Myxococcota bacterium]
MRGSHAGEARPQRLVVLLLDSLNRHMLGCYGGREFDTPNLDRLAERAVRFDRHHAGSLPCIPARHDLLCGALDFLWKPWGSIELWESSVTAALRRDGIVSMLITDHPHLFETGGENYHTDFTAWDYQRGHESDPWKTRPDPSWVGAPGFGRGHMPYDDSRGWFRGEEDFPGPRTLSAAARWLEQDAPHHPRFFLLVDEFDPHEPFDTPEPYASRYDPDWEGPHLIWPPYVSGGVRDAVLTEREARQLRACYGAKLTMIDRWLGRVLEAMDRAGLWRDTVLILCTDHGHYLGEHDIWGKPGVPVRSPLGHIPLLIVHPGVEPHAVSALTTTVDLFATITDLFAVEPAHRIHGRSLLPLLRGEKTAVRDGLLCGVFGRQVHWIDGTFNYARGPVRENAPLSMWSNRWSTMPIHPPPGPPFPLPDERAFLDRMPGSRVPVIRQPFREGDLLPFWSVGTPPGNHLWNLKDDPDELRDLAGSPIERQLEERLREALLEIEAPADQLERLGLS